jgi:hypothetical protein
MHTRVRRMGLSLRGNPSIRGDETRPTSQGVSAISLVGLPQRLSRDRRAAMHVAHRITDPVFSQQMACSPNQSRELQALLFESGGPNVHENQTLVRCFDVSRALDLKCPS